MANVPQNAGNAPNTGSGFVGYDEVNDTSAETRNFQFLGTGTTDGSGNLTITVTRAAGMTYTRWDAFAVAPAPVLTNYFWDGASGTPNGTSDGGTGTWDGATTNWDNGASVVWPNGSLSLASFGGTAGTVSLGLPSVTANKLDFTTTGYTLSATSSTIAAPVAIVASGSLTLNTPGSADTLVISGAVSGSGSSLTKTGDGTLTLGSTSSTYSGGLTVNGGTADFTGPGNHSGTNGSGPLTIATGATVNVGRTVPYGLGTAYNAPIAISGKLTLGQYASISSPVTLNGGTLEIYGSSYSDTYAAAQFYNGNVTTLASATPAQISNNTGGGAFLGVHLLAATKNANNGVKFDVADGSAAVDLEISATLANESGDAGGAVGALTKTGDGTMLLSGANTYTGSTRINGGKLTLSASGSLASSVVNVGSGASFDVNAVSGGYLLNSGKTLTGSGTVLGTVVADGGTLAPTGPLTVTSLNLNNSSSSLDVVPGMGSLTVTATDGLNTGVAGNFMAINVGTTPITSGTYTLIQFSGTIQGADGFAAFDVGINPGGDYTYDLVLDGSAIKLVVAPLAKLWTGAASNVWSTAVLSSPKNWKAGVAESDFLTNDTVLFDDSAVNTTVAINTANVSPTSVSFANNTQTYTLQGTAGIEGSTTLTKAGPGTLIINNSNSFTGVVFLDGGTVSVANVADSGTASALGAGTEIALGGGKLAYTGSTGSTNRLITLSAASNIEVTTPATTLTLSGEVASSGPLIKTGAGALALTFDNTYFGATQINAGILSVPTLLDGNIASPLGQSSNAAANLVLSGGTLSYTGATTASDRGFTLTAATTGTIAVTDSSAVLTLSGPVVGTGNFVKAGPGTLVRSANMNNIYAKLTVADGKFAVSTTNYNALNFNSPIEIAAGAVMSADNASFNAHNLGQVTLNGGTLTSVNGPTGPANDDTFGNWVVAGITVGGTTQSTISSSTIQLKTSGTGIIDVPDVTGSSATDLLVSASITEDGVYTIGATMTKIGDGTMQLTGHNTYTGNTNVNAGTLVLSDNARLTFVISNTNGSSNQLTGAGTVILDGDFAINTSAVTSLTTGTWVIENVPSLAGAYGASFTVIDPDGTPWTDAGSNKWTKTSGAREWTFDETTGTLTLAAAAGYSSWITGFGLAVGDQDPTDDPDGDGVNNLIEYALAGRNPSISDGNAGTFTGGLLSFSKRVDATGITYAIQESDDLGLSDPWTEVSSYNENTATVVSYNLLPVAGAKKFARLAVTQVSP